MRRYAQIPFSIINLLSDFVQLLLGIRFLFTFFHANIANTVVALLRSVTAPLVFLFTGIFPNSNFAGFTVEWSTVVAMFFYAIIAVLITRLFYLFVDVQDDLDPPVHSSHV